MTNMAQSMATRADLAELRQTVTHYHSSVVGHGILISDLEARVRRVEKHLDLPSV
jgi:signal transduction histidine kinase